MELCTTSYFCSSISCLDNRDREVRKGKSAFSPHRITKSRSCYLDSPEALLRTKHQGEKGYGHKINGLLCEKGFAVVAEGKQERMAFYLTFIGRHDADRGSVD